MAILKTNAKLKNRVGCKKNVRFVHPIVAQWKTPKEISFYPLDGSNNSKTAQIEFQLSQIKRFEVRTTCRWLEPKRNYRSGLLYRPLVSQHRFFFNLEYATKEKDNGSM